MSATPPKTSADETASNTTSVPTKTDTAPPVVNQEKDKDKEKEDIVAKYKRLLAMARSSLESNQTSLQEKDSQIKKLKKLLDEECLKTKQQQTRSAIPEEDSDSLPRNILRHLRVDDTIHLLVEYTSAGGMGGGHDTWLQFGSQVELRDWIQGVPGVPLVLPEECLTVEESARIQSESKKSVERIVEEFRRYKVRSEIARKQKDSEQKHSSNSAPAPSSVSGALSVEQAMSEGTRGYKSSSAASSSSPTSSGGAAGLSAEEVQERIDKETNRWKLAYESVVKENEQLRHRGGESLVAAQWRERYEVCRVEKDELLQKCKLVNNNSNANNNISGGSLSTSSEQGSGTSFQQLYLDLKAEYKEFHSRVLALEKERERKRELRRNGGGGEDKEKEIRRREAGSVSGSRIQPFNGGSGGEAGAAKHEYIKNLILQYLSCKDPLVRGHMEMAIVQMFRFTDDEKNAIDERKKFEENYEDALLSSITNFVSSTFYSSGAS